MMATQPKFTPGPWSLEVNSRNWEGSDLLVTTANGEWNIAECRPNRNLGPRNEEIAKANARLIAAAPDLYAALSDIMRCIAADELIPESVSYMKQARAALAKAERRDA